MGDEVLEIILESIAEGVYTVDREGRIGFWNRGAERITGYAKDAVVGSKCSDNLLRHVTAEGRELCVDGCPLAACLEDGQRREMEAFLHHRDGHRVPVEVKAVPIVGPDGRPSGSIEIFADRSERSRLLSDLEALRRESLVDPLTGLGNRRFGDLSLERAFADAAGDETPLSARGFGILMIDIDHFKSVNDEYGHPNGDRVLRMVGWTLANAVRRMDSAARWGGEEFLVVAPGADREILREIAERIRVLVERSWLRIDGERIVTVTASVGGAVYRHGDEREGLITRADERLYACKSAGRNRCEVI